MEGYKNVYRGLAGSLITKYRNVPICRNVPGAVGKLGELFRMEMQDSSLSSG